MNCRKVFLSSANVV